ncbi:MAG: hypothetical protein IKH24_08485 [Bacteroidales bacterium]|nr:hypothetical protein [Bacteroidales bacterium]
MKRFVLFAQIIFLLVSCTAEMDQVLNTSRVKEDPGQKMVFYASTESSRAPDSPSTKVYADENMKVLWNEGDQITIFNKDTYNHGFEFDGEDGDTAGGFEQFTDEPTGFYTGGDLNYYYAVYPYNTGTKINNSGKMTVTLPSEQSYKENSFGIGANTMVAMSDSFRLRFKNVGGYLSIRLYGDNVKVSSVTIKGNNNEKIAGKATVSIPLGGVPTTVMDNSATDEITIFCSPAVQLGADADHYTDFWFVIPPVTFENGFTITVTDELGGVYEKSSTRSLTITRNQLDWMNPLEVKIDSPNSGTQVEYDLVRLHQVVEEFIELDAFSNYYNRELTFYDSLCILNVLKDFSEIRENCLQYVFDPSSDSRDRRYFKYCTGYDGKPVIDSIKFSDITWGDLNSHVFDLTTTRLDNYDEGDVVHCNVFSSLCLQLFNSDIASLFYEELQVEGYYCGLAYEFSDPETSINADNYNAFFGRYRYDATLGAIVPLFDN